MTIESVFITNLLKSDIALHICVVILVRFSVIVV